MERRTGSEAGAMMCSPFPEGDVAALGELVTNADVDDVRIRIAVGAARYPSPAEVVLLGGRDARDRLT